jgi:low affinity Fe/Cu permease
VDGATTVEGATTRDGAKTVDGQSGATPWETKGMSWIDNLSWILERPVAIIFVGLITVAILFGGLVQTGKKWLLYVLIGAALFFAGLVVVEQLVVTRREQVENTVYQIARDVEANNADAVEQHLSKARPELRAEARYYMGLLHVEQAKVKSDLRVELHLDQNPPTATARFHAMLIGSDRSGDVHHQRYPKGFIVQFVFEDGAWHVYDYEMREVQQSL